MNNNIHQIVDSTLVDHRLRPSFTHFLSLTEPSSLTTPLSDAEDSYEYALSSNGAWAGYKAHQNPEFFHKLASGQSPQIREYLQSTPSSLCIVFSYCLFLYNPCLVLQKGEDQIS